MDEEEQFLRRAYWREAQRKSRAKRLPVVIAARAESDALTAELVTLIERKALIDRLIKSYESD